MLSQKSSEDYCHEVMINVDSASVMQMQEEVRNRSKEMIPQAVTWRWPIIPPVWVIPGSEGIVTSNNRPITSKNNIFPFVLCHPIEM